MFDGRLRRRGSLATWHTGKMNRIRLHHGLNPAVVVNVATSLPRKAASDSRQHPSARIIRPPCRSVFPAHAAPTRFTTPHLSSSLCVSYQPCNLPLTRFPATRFQVSTSCQGQSGFSSFSRGFSPPLTDSQDQVRALRGSGVCGQGWAIGAV